MHSSIYCRQPEERHGRPVRLTTGILFASGSLLH
ncbi:hypothetical protein GO002_25670 [Streptomyces eurocidicus]|nr:hypothetical protein [Streptomyces eurocidicus]